MRLATIGTSYITEIFIDAARQTEMYELEAVYSRNIESGNEFAKKVNCSKVYTDVEEMMKDENIDIVYIASPNSLHFTHTMTCLKNKKHVICEKPLFSNLYELEQAFACAKENGVFLFEAIKNVNNPNSDIIVEKFDDLGEILNVNFNFCVRYPDYDQYLRGEIGNHLNFNLSGGVIGDLGVYPLYLAYKFFGEPTSYEYNASILSTGVDGSGNLVLNYDKFICTIVLSGISIGHQKSEIQGTNGTIILDSLTELNAAKYYDIITNETTDMDFANYKNNMVFEAKYFAEYIKNNNVEAFEKAEHASRVIQIITDAARIQNNIIF